MLYQFYTILYIADIKVKLCFLLFCVIYYLRYSKFFVNDTCPFWNVVKYLLEHEGDRVSIAAEQNLCFALNLKMTAFFWFFFLRIKFLRRIIFFWTTLKRNALSWKLINVKSMIKRRFKVRSFCRGPARSSSRKNFKI